MTQATETREANAAPTPGPWNVHRENIADIDGFHIRRIPIEASGQAIAAVWNGSPGTKFASNGKANARLISAAPDLLAALKLLMEDSRFNVAVGGNPIAVEKMLAQVRAAISKAEGRQP